MSEGSSTPPHWNRRAAANSPQNASAVRRRRLLGATAILLALVGTTLGLLTYFAGGSPVPSAALSLPILHYSNGLYPVNPFAIQDATAILQHFPQEGGRQRNLGVANQRYDQIDQELKQLANHKGKPLVVHLTCLAMSWKGETYLLPGDARPDQAASWYPLATVLKRFADCQEPHQLLLLDLAHPLADTRLGVLSDDVAESVHKVVTAHAPPRLLVLCSCAPGQISHASEDLRLSVFAHAVDQGLQGGADGWNQGGRKSSWVSARELAEFVRLRTDRIAQAVYGRPQTPWLWGDAKDFELAQVPRDPPAEEAPAAPAYPAELQKAWEARDRLWKDRKIAPQALHFLEVQLLRLEQQWRFGRELEKLADDAKKLKDTFETGWLIQDWDLPETSLAQVDWRAPVLALPAESIRFTLEKARQAAAKNAKEDWKKVKEELFEFIKLELLKDKKVEEKTVRSKSYLPVAAALLEALVQVRELHAKHLVFAEEALQELKDPGTASYMETMWLQRVAAFAERLKVGSGEVKEWPGGTVSQALRALRARERTIARALVEAVPLPAALAARFSKGEATRRLGEKLFFWDKPGQWLQAEKLLQQAELDYKAVHDQMEGIRDCRRAVADAFALLPGYLPVLNGEEKPGHADDVWSEAVREAKRLADLLIKDAGAGDAVADGAELDSRLTELQTTIETMARQQIDRKSAASLTRIDLLLASPRLPAKLRVELWQAGRALAANSLGKLPGETEAEQRQALAATVLPRAAGYELALTAQAWRRARRSLELLELADVPGLAAVQNELERVKGKPQLADLDPLAEVLRNAWAQMPEHHRVAGVGLAHADRLGRLVPLMEVFANQDPQKAPAYLWRQQQMRTFKLWLAKEYREESRHLRQSPLGAEVDVQSEFFLRVARNLERP